MYIPLLPQFPRGQPRDSSSSSSSSESSRHPSPNGNPLSDLITKILPQSWTHTQSHNIPGTGPDPHHQPKSPSTPDRHHTSLRSRNGLTPLYQSMEKRDMDSMQSRDITIGVIVGVVLLVFLAGLFFFLYRYHASIRLTKRRRHRRYGSSSRSGGSSKGSHSTFSGGEVPPPPPPGA